MGVGDALAGAPLAPRPLPRAAPPRPLVLTLLVLLAGEADRLDAGDEDLRLTFSAGDADRPPDLVLLAGDSDAISAARCLLLVAREDITAKYIPAYQK